MEKGNGALQREDLSLASNWLPGIESGWQGQENGSVDSRKEWCVRRWCLIPCMFKTRSGVEKTLNYMHSWLVKYPQTVVESKTYIWKIDPKSSRPTDHPSDHDKSPATRAPVSVSLVALPSLLSTKTTLRSPDHALLVFVFVFAFAHFPMLLCPCIPLPPQHHKRHQILNLAHPDEHDSQLSVITAAASCSPAAASNALLFTISIPGPTPSTVQEGPRAIMYSGTTTMSLILLTLSLSTDHPIPTPSCVGNGPCGCQHRRTRRIQGRRAWWGGSI